MKKQVLIFTLLTFAFTIQSIAQWTTIRPSGNVTTEKHNVGDFTGLKVSTDFKAYITFGSSTSVEIESDDNMHQYLKVAVEAGTLVIRQKGSINVKGRETLIAHITVPSLKMIDASGDAIVELKNKLVSDQLDIELSGDSKLNGQLEVNDMEVRLRGDSYMTVSGVANKVRANVKGDSHIKSYDFTINDLKLDLSGDSVAKLTVTESMDVDISGDSVMKYKGSPSKVSQRVRGDSELAKVD